MKTLTITKEHGRFVVDDKSLPGIPIVGRGFTMLEAIGNWFIGNQIDLGYHFDTTAVQKTEDRRRSRELAKR